MSIDEKDIHKRLKYRALKLLTTREYSEAELLQKLTQKPLHALMEKSGLAIAKPKAQARAAWGTKARSGRSGRFGQSASEPSSEKSVPGASNLYAGRSRTQSSVSRDAQDHEQQSGIEMTYSRKSRLTASSSMPADARLPRAKQVFDPLGALGSGFVDVPIVTSDQNRAGKNVGIEQTASSFDEVPAPEDDAPNRREILDAQAVVAARVVEEMRALGYLSDTRFAEGLIRREGGLTSARALTQKMKHAGVDAESIQSALSQREGDDESAARALWQRKFRAVPENDKEKARQVRFMVRQGFSVALALRVMRGGAVDDE